MSSSRPPVGFLLVLLGVVALLAVGFVRGTGSGSGDGSGSDGAPAAVPSPIAVTAESMTRPRGCRGGHVALTFDDGPSDTTDEILDVLADAGARATFFNVGAREEKHPDLVRRTAAEGHHFGNHSFDHAFLDELSPELLHRNLLGTNQIHLQLTGESLRWFRPPYGRTNARIQATARELGMQRVLWTNDARDWEPDRTARDVVREVLEAEPGEVVLLHDDGLDTTVAALPVILERWARDGICTGELRRADRRVRAWDGAVYRVDAGPWQE